MLAAHKHLATDSKGLRCVQIRIVDGVQSASVDGRILHELEVAHAEIAMRFAQKTMNDAYDGGWWVDGLCEDHPFEIQKG